MTTTFIQMTLQSLKFENKLRGFCCFQLTVKEKENLFKAKKKKIEKKFKKLLFIKSL